MSNETNTLEELKQSWDHMNEWELRDECWRQIELITSLQAKNDYTKIPKQGLLDCHLNIFGLDLFLESFLKAVEVPDKFCFFFRINRSDCAEFKGVNVHLEPVRKTPEENNDG